MSYIFSPFYAHMHRRALLVWLFVLVISVLIWIQPLFLDRLVLSIDYRIHLQWSSQFFAGLAEGKIYPRWAFSSHGGLGDPTFLYYQPGLYYLTSLLTFIGFSAQKALIWSSWLPCMVMGLVVASTSKQNSIGLHTLYRVALVLSCPVLFFLFTHYGALPWVAATPFCLLLVLESIKDTPSLRYIGVWLSLACLTHLLSAFMVLICVGFARLIYSVPCRKSIYGHVVWVCGIFLGLALSAFYLYPALFEQKLINPSGWLDDPTLDWHRSFAFPTITYLQYGHRWFSMQWPLPLLALAMSSLVLFITRRSARVETVTTKTNQMTSARRLAIVAVVGLVLSSELAYPLYYFLSPLQKLQWPYRFVALCLVLSTLAFSMVIFPCQTSYFKQRSRNTVVHYIAILIMIVHCVFGSYLQYSVLTQGKPLPSLESVMQGEFGQPEYLPEIRGRNWPLYNVSDKFRGECQRLDLQCLEVTKGAHTFFTTIETASYAEIRLPVFAFPGWRITIDGTQHPLLFDADTGLALVKLSPGRHDVFLYWGGVKGETIGRWISVVALLMMAYSIYYSCRDFRKKSAFITQNSASHPQTQERTRGLLS